jgi:hypothetical protein
VNVALEDVTVAQLLGEVILIDAGITTLKSVVFDVISLSSESNIFIVNL